MKDEALNQLARSLAAELSAADFPHMWRVQHKRGDWWTNITTNDAWIMLQRNDKRIVISADLPRQMKRASNGERITVADDRKPEAIARDIVNRLLPNAREHWQKSLDYTRKDKAERARHTEILHTLEPFKTWKQTDSDGRRSSFYAERAHLDIYAAKVSSIKIDSPTMDEVIQIMQLLERTPKQNDYDTE